jgi:peptide/nickel transport system substrate-binding protein
MNPPHSPAHRLGVASLLLAGALVAGCGETHGPAATWRDTHPLPADTMTVDMPSTGTYGGRFIYAQTAGPKTFNPMMVNETGSSDVTNRLFTSLTDYHNLLQQDTPLLAKSWEVGPDRRTWIFRLRRGAAFSDGHPITSSDVLFSFGVAYDDSLHPLIQDMLKMDGRKFDVSAPDSYTVVIRTPAPNPLMAPIAGAVRILPRHVLEPAFRAGRFASAYGVTTAPDSLVTSGPWTLRQYVAGEKTVLTRNPYWFGVDAKGQRLPYLDELVFVIVRDQDAADLKFRAGEVHALDNVKPENYPWYADHQASGGYRLYDLGPALISNFFWFNLNRVRAARPGLKAGDPCVPAIQYARFANPVFRRAVSLAIDRDAMIRSVFFGEAVKNWSTATPANRAWYTPDIVRYDYDPARAKLLLAGLGWKDANRDGYLEDARGRTIEFTMKTNADSKLRVAMANFIRDDLAKVGIRMTLAPVELGALIANLREDFQYESILLGLQGGVPPDPRMGQNTWRSSGPTHYWNSRQPTAETADEARIDRLMDDLVSTPDSTARRRDWREIQNIVNQECWFIWLPTIDVKVPVRDGFGNVQPAVIPHRILWNIDRVYAKARATGA